MLMTALSRADAARDVAFLDQMRWGDGGPPTAVLSEPYADSPFCSLLSASGDGLVGGGGDEAASAQSGGKGAAANSCFRVLLP